MSYDPFAIPDDLKSPVETNSQTADGAPSARPLHPLSGVVVATFLGTPIAGSIVIALSLWRLGRKTAAWVVVSAIMLLTIGFFILLFVMPENNIPNTAYTVPQLVIMYLLGKQLYGRQLLKQERARGPVASTWKGAGIGLLCLLVVVPVVLVGAFLHEGVGFADLGGLLVDHGTLVEFADDEVYFDGDATREDANKLAGALKELDFFGSGGGVTVRIRREGSQTIISFVLIDGAWDDETTVDEFHQIGVGLNEAGFDPPLSIELCDDVLRVHRSFDIEN